MKNKNKKVILGISGGVDSSVAAYLLKNKGYEVIGVFMKNFSDTKDPITGECSWKQEKRLAEEICSMLSIPFKVVDYEKYYKKDVIDPMYQEYKKGRTPNPDIDCNKTIKFPALLKVAKQENANYISTGHYARIKQTRSGPKLYSGKDKNKDQTYFLYNLDSRTLEKTLFPIGNLTKEKVRKLAKKLNFPNYDKPGTKGICFIGKMDFKKFLEKKIKNKRGKVLSPEGKVIGTHPGIMYFTIGEKVGLKEKVIINNEYRNKVKTKLYVADKKSNNTLIVAPEDHPILKKQTIQISRLHLINPNQKLPKNLKARIRHLGELHKGTLVKEKSTYLFKLKHSLQQIAPGQALVLYKNYQLLGGGVIKKAT